MNAIKAQRMVIKIGSSLVASEEGTPRQEWLDGVADDIAVLREGGAEVLIVTSGAVALGSKRLGLEKSKVARKLEEKQAAAACGQIALAQAYQQSFARHKITTAQILLSIEDSENRRRYLNARSTLTTLLSKAVIPLINENDTVATEELRVGDNDRLAARVAQMMGADLLILLSDVDGLYTANPYANKKAKHVAVVEVIDEKIEAMAGGALSGVGSGGMITKIAAARIATGSGCDTIITRGTVSNPIKKLMEGGKHTRFVAHGTPHNARKRWISDTLKAMGNLVIDDGAVAALRKGKSLLPAGVVSVSGRFERGDSISIRDAKGKEIARGLSAYSSDDAQRIIGHNTTEIEKILGYAGRDALVHRDDLVIK